MAWSRVEKKQRRRILKTLHNYTSKQCKDKNDEEPRQAQMAERRGRAGRRKAQVRFPLKMSGTCGNMSGTRRRNWPGTDECCTIAILILGFHPRI